MHSRQWKQLSLKPIRSSERKAGPEITPVQDAACLTGANQMSAPTVSVCGKMICRARCSGYNWVTKWAPLPRWADLCCGDEWAIGQRVISRANNG